MVGQRLLPGLRAIPLFSLGIAPALKCINHAAGGPPNNLVHWLEHGMRAVCYYCLGLL